MSLLNKLNSYKANLEIISKEDENYKPPTLNESSLLLKICSVFSILFSLTTITQLYTATTPILFIGVLCVFLLTILIFNEKYKVSSIVNATKQYQKEGKLNFMYTVIAITTLLISLSSVYGLYTGIDKIVDLNSIEVNQPQNTTKTKIDSLNNLLLYKTDSLAIESNKIANENIIAYTKDRSKLGYYDKEEKAELTEKINNERLKLDKTKKDIEVYLNKEISILTELERKMKTIDNKGNNNANLIKMALAILALITELVIVGSAINKGSNVIKYEKDLEEYNSKFNIMITKKKKELLSKPHIKKMLDYISILEMLYDLNTDEITKKSIEDITELKGRKYTVKEVDDFRTIAIQLNILTLQSNNKTRISMEFEEAKETIDKYFSKIK